jgi:hypothetical protein
MTPSDLEPSELNQSIGTAMNNILSRSAPTHGIASRLRAKFGLGAIPKATIGFYEKIERIVEANGDRAYQAVAESMAQSVGKRYPANYFAKAVIGKLKELGWWNPVVPW